MTETQQVLDTILDNYLTGTLALSEMVRSEYQKAYEQGQGEEFSLEELARISERLTKVITGITENAPFLIAKIAVEGTEQLKDALLHSTDITGQTRGLFLSFIAEFQRQQLLSIESKQLPRQYTLL